MHEFERLFRESRGQPINFKGHVIQLVHMVPVSDGQTIKIVFESTNSDWRQGVSFTVENGEVEVAERVVKNGVVLWNDTAPRETYLTVRFRNGRCYVKNVWDKGDGLMDSWRWGAAMMVGELDSGFRYECNDGHDDCDFDELVFRIELR